MSEGAKTPRARTTRLLSGAALGGEPQTAPQTVRARALADLERMPPAPPDLPPPPTGMKQHERAYILLRDMPPEKRARGRGVAAYQEVADLMGVHRDTVVGWAASHQWARALLAHDMESDAIGRKAAHAAIERRAEALAGDLFAMASQCLVLSNRIFLSYWDAEKGEMRRHVEIKDVPEVIRAGLACAAAAADLATRLGMAPGAMTADAWGEALSRVPAKDRLVMVRGLRAVQQLRSGGVAPDSADTGAEPDTAQQREG